MEILIQYCKDNRDSCLPDVYNPKEQPHPFARKVIEEFTYESTKQLNMNLEAKINEEGDPYIACVNTYEFPEDWFETGKDHQVKEDDLTITRVQTKELWVATITTLKEFRTLMEDLRGELYYDSDEEYPYYMYVWK